MNVESRMHEVLRKYVCYQGAYKGTYELLQYCIERRVLR